MIHSISSLFGKSPVRPIQHHMQKVQSCVAKLSDFTEALLAEDWEEAASVHEQICEDEHEADELKNELRANLPKSLLMPVARADVLALLGMQDKLANRAKDISGLMLGRRMKIPDSLQAIFRDFVARNIEATGSALNAIAELDELFESGFDARELSRVDELVQIIDGLENDCDDIQVKLRSSLLKIEDSLAPVPVMFLYRIIEELGDISDIAHRVGNRLTILLAK